MGTKNQPGKFDCYANAKPDEPMFVLLGRDPVASLLVALWADLRRGIGETDAAMLSEAEACAEAMEAWAVGLGKGDRIKAACLKLVNVTSELRGDFLAASTPLTPASASPGELVGEPEGALAPYPASSPRPPGTAEMWTPLCPICRRSAMEDRESRPVEDRAPCSRCGKPTFFRLPAPVPSALGQVEPTTPDTDGEP